jgi:hypothetical protein
MVARIGRVVPRVGHDHGEERHLPIGERPELQKQGQLDERQGQQGDKKNERIAHKKAAGMFGQASTLPDVDRKLQHLRWQLGLGWANGISPPGAARRTPPRTADR